MKISLEFDTVDEWTQFINSFKKYEMPREAPKSLDASVSKLFTATPELTALAAQSMIMPDKPSKKRKSEPKVKDYAGSPRIKKQITRAILYAKKHNIDFSKAIKKLYNRYASNWDYEIAERLGYPDPRKKKAPSDYDEKAAKSNFITKRTRLLTEIGWERDEAEKAAGQAWELGERDPDNFSQTKAIPPGRE